MIDDPGEGAKVVVVLLDQGGGDQECARHLSAIRTGQPVVLEIVLDGTVKTHNVFTFREDDHGVALEFIETDWTTYIRAGRHC